MATCYIICNVNNDKSDYIVSSLAGSSISFYVGTKASSRYDVEIVNIGAPKKRMDSNMAMYSFDHFTIVEFGSGHTCLPIRIRSKIMIENAFNYVYKNFKSGDKVIVYHSLSFMHWYSKLVKKVGMDNCILLVAEIYSDVGNVKYNRKKEIKKINGFAKFIFMSSGIKEQIIGYSNKKFVYLYGAYNVHNKNKKKSNDSKTHLVYAGTSSSIKGGVYNAIKSCSLLGEKYILHLYTNMNEDIKTLLNSSKNVFYEGYIPENELFKELQKYDIGLATQNPNLLFNNSSFPSKIVNYLANGLSVISTKSISVLNSPFKDKVTFYDVDDEVSLKNAILKASNFHNRENNLALIKEMDLDFAKKILLLFETNY